MGWIWIGCAAVSHLVGSGATLLDKELLKKISPRLFFVMSEVMWLPLLLFLLFFDAWNARIASFIGAWAFLYYPVSFEQWIIALRPGWCASFSIFLLYCAIRRGTPSRVVMAVGVAKPVVAAAVSAFWLGRAFSGLELFALFFLLAAAWSAGFSLFSGAISHDETHPRTSLFWALASGIGFGLHAIWWHQSAKDTFPLFTALYWQGIGQLCVMAVVLAFSVRPVRAWMHERRKEFLVRHKSNTNKGKESFVHFVRLYIANKTLGLTSVGMSSIAIAYGDPVFVSSLDGVKYLASFFNEYRVGVKRVLGWKWAIGAGIFLFIGLAILAWAGKGV